MKSCTEIRFAHGGHMFACAYASTKIDVFHFYTGANPDYLKFIQMHSQRITSIDWFENDLGFWSAGHDGNIYPIDKLYKLGENQPAKNDAKEFQMKDVKFSCVVGIPNKPYEFLAVGNDMTIHTELDSIKIPAKPSLDGSLKPPELPKLDKQISQLAVHNSGRTFFAGVDE